MENASHCYSNDKVKKIVERGKKKYGREFLFIGANIDTVEVSKNIDLGCDWAVSYRADKQDTQLLYETVYAMVGMFRTDEPFEADCGKRLEDDNNSKK